MLNFMNSYVFNVECAIRGMRNSFDSWQKSDSEGNLIGPEDMQLAKKLVKAGSSHRKFLRQIFVTTDLIMPMYFAKELDTYKIGTVRNSTSTMHTITNYPITWERFSFDEGLDSFAVFTITACEELRQKYLETKDKKYWRMLIQLLPSGWNQMSTITFNYEVLRNIYFDRKNHRLSEWHEFCEWIERLPYAAELITYKGD